MNKIVSILLSFVLLFLTTVQTNEVQADVSTYFGFESKTVTKGTSFNLNYYVRGNTGFDSVNFANVKNDLNSYGFTINSISAGDLVSDNEVTIGAKFATVAVTANSTVTNDGVLLVFNLTANETGTVTFSEGPALVKLGNDYFRVGIDETTIKIEGSGQGGQTSSSYIVSYNANGGTGAPDSQAKDQGQAINLSNTVPTWAGHEFLGWASTSDATTAEYASGASFNVDANITLYAVWRLITYRISFDPNGGTGAPDAGTKQVNVDYEIPNVTPTRANYDFVGWNTRSDGKGTTYLKGDKYTTNANVTLYAMWTNKATTINYNVNGAIEGIEPVKAKVGTTTKITSIVPEKTGYNFLGWALDDPEGEPTYASGSPFEVPNKIVTFYAIWEIKTYTLTFDLNGGTGNFPVKTRQYNRSSSIPTDIPTRDSYMFLGWSEDKNATTATYQPGDALKKNENVILYAIWVKTYQITFDSNGGSEAPAAITKVDGTDIKLPSDKLTWSKHVFKGWSKIKGALTAEYAPGATFSLNKDTTLYAVWLEKYTLKFDTQGGTPAISNITKVQGTDVTLPSDTLYKTGYDFLGWAESADATKAKYKAGATYTADKGRTLYAVYRKSTYKITFNANGGSGSFTKTAQYGDTFTINLKDSEIPVRDGYYCIGFATSKKATDPKYTLIYPESFKVTSPVTLYAVWIPNPFPDVPSGKWYTRYIAFANYREAMTGYKTGKFGVGDNLTRADAVTLLWKLAGQPEVDNQKTSFRDVKKGCYYTGPITWAVENKVVSGRQNGTFAPLENITRQDFIKILYDFTRYIMKESVAVSNATKYLEKADANKVANYAKTMVNWGYVNGFIGSGSNLDPTGFITREQAATMISRLLVKYGK